MRLRLIRFDAWGLRPRRTPLTRSLAGAPRPAPLSRLTRTARSLGRHSFFIYVALLGSFTAPTLLRGQGKPAPIGALTGVVVDGTSGEPVADAVVFLAAVPARPIGAQARQVSDEKGRFAFVNLPGDANYTIAASALGYLEGGYGRDIVPSDPLRPIPLKTDEWIPNIKVSIWRPGGISGTVR